VGYKDGEGSGGKKKEQWPRSLGLFNPEQRKVMGDLIVAYCSSQGAEKC